MEDQVLDVNEEERDYEKLAASKGLRFGNLLADAFLVGIPISFLANYLVYGDWIVESREMLRHMDLYVFSTLLNYGIFIIYFVVMEHTTGKTVGKMMTGTHVVNHKGQKPTLGQIVGRAFARLIPFEAFSFLGEKGIGWHDSLTKTYVIKDQNK
ncbi:MAG: RDD family protein [Bacteroidetes bacterium]|nr:RDD family protein [Bacteroidota bacterium]